MSARPGDDLSDLIKWTARDAWRSHVDDVMAEHFEPAMEAFGLEFEEIDEALGGNWGGTLWGCAFEDFLTRRFGPDDQNPVEAYLRRRGWKEHVATRAYMTALKNSVMSLYEVSDIVPGQSLRARDLIRGGEPVLVTERSATQTLKSWDRIAARIVPQADRSVLAGGVLAFTLEGSRQLFAQLRERGGQASGRQRGVKKSQDALEGWRGSDDELRRAAPLFSTAWLFDVLPRALRTDSPTLVNSEGDEVVFHTVNFPLAPGATADEVGRRLNALDQLKQETPGLLELARKESAPAHTPQRPESAHVERHDGRRRARGGQRRDAGPRRRTQRQLRRAGRTRERLLGRSAWGIGRPAADGDPNGRADESRPARASRPA